jgi:tetratricopeptide (TPR) repeat protein
LGNSKEAIDDFTSSIKCAPNPLSSEWAYSRRGSALSAIGNYKQSLSDLDMAVKLNPGEADHYLERGKTFLAMGNAQKTVEETTMAINLTPNLSSAFAVRAKANQLLNQKMLAEGDVQRAKELEDVNELLKQQLSTKYAEEKIKKLESAKAKQIRESFWMGWACFFWSIVLTFMMFMSGNARLVLLVLACLFGMTYQGSKALSTIRKSANEGIKARGSVPAVILITIPILLVLYFVVAIAYGSPRFSGILFRALAGF